MVAEPDYAVATGEHIEEWMEDEGINAAELARRLDVTRKHVSELLSGKAPLSHSTALALESVTGIPARIWNLYESGYRSDLARLAERQKLEDQYAAAREFPLGYLRKWGIITAPVRDHVGTVRGLLEFLGVASLSAFRTTWTSGSVAYRRTAAARDDSAALTVWLRLAEQHHDGHRDDLPGFDHGTLEALVPELRALTLQPPVEALEEAVGLLRSAGVLLCYHPAMPGLGIHGVTRWLGEHPVIQLSLLMKSDDQLWFTLFHELAHVLLHNRAGLFVDDDKTDAEDEANRWASTTLVPDKYRDRLPTCRDIAAVEELAQELGIAPSIVLGQAQHATGDYRWGHRLKRKLEFVVEPDGKAA